MSSIESRRTKRKNLALKGNFNIKDDLKYKLHIYKEPIDLTLIDISALGCGFATEYYLPKGLAIHMRLKNFPVAGTKRETKDIEFDGKVMFSRTSDFKNNRIGLEFSNLGKEISDLVKNYIESE